jgi:hypothetical protein
MERLLRIGHWILFHNQAGKRRAVLFIHVVKSLRGARFCALCEHVATSGDDMSDAPVAQFGRFESGLFRPRKLSA